ncbi:MAG: hypothetical protein JNM63_18495, partial [Spirochaetia bacterium]|nr:hypothetical protein [Spirochaetia bacterium]
MSNLILNSAFIAVCSLLFSIPLFPQTASNSATGLNYSSVQNAVNAATNNYTVFVLANEVNNGISVTGKTNLVLTKAASFSGNPLLKSSTLGSGTGITVSASRSVVISNLCIAEYGQGIGLASDSNRVTGCEIRSNAGYGVYMTVSTSRGNIVASNTITALNGYSGIEMNTTASNNTAISNHVYGSQYGATLGEFGATASNVLLNNHFDENWNIGVKIGP